MREISTYNDEILIEGCEYPVTYRQSTEKE